MAKRAQLGSPNQSGPEIPILASNALSRPSGWYMKSHSMETTTMEVTMGRKKTVRKKFKPGNFLFTSSAIISARPDCPGTITRAKMRVLRKDAQKTSVPKSRSKFSRPMNCIGRGEMRRASVNARTKVRTMGTTRKSSMRIPAGASIPHPARACAEVSRRYFRDGAAAGLAR